MSNATTLTERHAETTRNLILGAAIELLERSGVRELTARAVATHARISERTIFRHHASRETLLDAVAAEAARRIAAPAPPARLSELPGYARLLYASYEKQAALVAAALHTELFDRIREGTGRERWQAVSALVDEQASRRLPRERKLATAAIRFQLTATAWHYHRAYFGFTADEASDAAERAVRLAVDDLLRH
jgi:AcrR family transcriptional regulator